MSLRRTTQDENSFSGELKSIEQAAVVKTASPNGKSKKLS